MAKEPGAKTSRTTSSNDRVSAQVEVSDTPVLLALTGPNGQLLKILAEEVGIEVSLRGNTILIVGESENVAFAERFLAEASSVVRAGTKLETHDYVRALRSLRADPTLHLRDLADDVVLVTPRHRAITPKGLAQKRYIEAIRTHDLTFCIGPAGTGKTYLAMAMAVHGLLSRAYKRIILTRPAVEAGEKLGFLPGDLVEKVNPYLRPLYDAMHDMMDLDKAEGMIARGQIEVAPLAFMRGRTLNDCFVILDEAQNATSEQMRMFLTRLGYASKAVVTGDITQVDLPAASRSGLAEARNLLEGIPGISFCRLTEVDVVRHPLVQKIIVAYEKRDAQMKAEREQREGRHPKDGASSAIDA